MAEFGGGRHAVDNMQFPPEIAVSIINHLVDDPEALCSIALTCQEFCALVQSHKFATIRLNWRARPTSVTLFEQLLASQHRGAVIASYIRHLSLLFCDDWFTDYEDDELDSDQEEGIGKSPEGDKDIEMEEVQDQDDDDDDDDKLEAGDAENRAEENAEEDRDHDMLDPTEPFFFIRFISEHAKGIQTIHLGPFDDMCMDWHEISKQAQDALTCLFKNATAISLEGITNIPLSLFQELRNLESFDVSDLITSGERPHRWTPLPPSPPSPLSLAVHTGCSGAVSGHEQWWDMTGFLDAIIHLKIMDFTRLTTLHLYSLDYPGRNRLIQQLLSSCANTLHTLRLFVWEEDIYDRQVINLSHLTSLRSLYLIVNLAQIQDSLLHLARTIDTIDIHKTHLEDLKMILSVNNNYEDPTDMTSYFPAATDGSQSWNTLLHAKLSLMFKKWNDTQVTLALPRWGRLRDVNLFNAAERDCFRAAFPIIFKSNDTTRGRLEIQGYATRDQINKYFTFRSEEEFLEAMEDI